MDLMVAATIDNIMMVEGEMKEVSEDDLLAAPQGGARSHQGAMPGTARNDEGRGQDRKTRLLPRGKRRGTQERHLGENLRQGLRPGHLRQHRQALARSQLPPGEGRLHRHPRPRSGRSQGRHDRPLLPRRGKGSHAPLHPRRRQAARRPQDHRHTPHLVRSGLPARPPRLGHLHARRDAIALDRHPRHQDGRKKSSTKPSSRARTASCCTTTSRPSPPARHAPCAA